MLPVCPTRRHTLRRRAPAPLRRPRLRRPRRRPLGCALRTAPRFHELRDALAGSYDPVWAARAQGRFINGALRSRDRRPAVIAVRVLVLTAIASSALAPAVGMAREAGVPLPSGPALAGAAVLAVAGVTLLLTRE